MNDVAYELVSEIELRHKSDDLCYYADVQCRGTFPNSIHVALTQVNSTEMAGVDASHATCLKIIGLHTLREIRIGGSKDRGGSNKDGYTLQSPKKNRAAGGRMSKPKKK